MTSDEREKKKKTDAWDKTLCNTGQLLFRDFFFMPSLHAFKKQIITNQVNKEKNNLNEDCGEELAAFQVICSHRSF